MPQIWCLRMCLALLSIEWSNLLVGLHVRTVVVNKKLTFSSVVRSFSEESVSVFTPFRVTWKYSRVHPLFLCSCKCLSGRHDHTTIIDRSRCCVEETSFRERWRSKLNQPSCRLNNIADIKRRLYFCILSIARYVSHE